MTTLAQRGSVRDDSEVGMHLSSLFTRHGQESKRSNKRNLWD